MPPSPFALQLLLITHAAATWFMCGLIWFVQLVHYPLLARLPAADRRALAAIHANRTTLIVAPIMLVELIASLLLVALPLINGSAVAPALRTPLTSLGIGVLAVAWLSTFLVQVPLHSKLQAGSDAAGHALVATNWLRTAAWSARSIIAALLLLAA